MKIRINTGCMGVVVVVNGVYINFFYPSWLASQALPFLHSVASERESDFDELEIVEPSKLAG